MVVILAGIGLVYFNGPKENLKTSPVSEGNEFKSDSLGSIVNGIHVATGLKDAQGLSEVITNCTTCHSSKLVIQNRMGKEQWNATIRWMQETQGLWDLGDNQEIIVDYLTTNYPVFKKGRRAALKDIDWYTMNEK